MLDQNQRELSVQIDRLARGLSQWILDRHEELDPERTAALGPEWRKVFLPEVETRLRHLAQAVAVGRPEIFGHISSWSRHAFTARGLTHADLRVSLEATGRVIEDEFPPEVAGQLAPYVDAALRACESGESSLECFSKLEETNSTALRYLELLLERKSREAVEVVLDAARDGMPIGEIYEKIVVPAQVQIGELWHDDDIDISDEHYATATTLSIFGQLRPFFPKVELKNRHALATCCSGEPHEIGLRVIADHLELDGWSVQLLGPNVPLESIHDSLTRFQIDLLVLSLTSWLHLRDLADVITVLRAQPEHANLRIMVGGGPFLALPELAEQIGADGTACSGADAVALANRLTSDRDQAVDRS